jgi:DNA modification methylase
MSNVNLMHGDCLERMSEIPDASVAALQLYRRFIGIEISEEYFKISQARIQLHEDNDDPASWQATWTEKLRS